MSRLTSRCLLLFITTLTVASWHPIAAQAQGRTAANWSETEQQTFLNGCQDRAAPRGISEAQLPAYCQCVLSRLIRFNVPLADINDATQNHPTEPNLWSEGFYKSVTSCLP
ncbi:MAG: hypothetical protein F6J87_17140 [Spirulina sp. SIO3F2]|nr:hypothetical protein [Spirulina sp. SIO3F2]